MRIKNDANLLLEKHLAELGIEFQKEFKFHACRKWRFDYMLSRSAFSCAIEIEGGIHTGGRHVRGKGYANDLEKYRMATAMGYLVYRFSTEEVLNGTAKKFIKENCL